MQEQPLLSEIVKAFYKIHYKKDTRLLFNELSKAFRSCIDSYFRIFIIINALDELINIDKIREYLLHEISELQN
jgi:hypothetical protein